MKIRHAFAAALVAPLAAPLAAGCTTEAPPPSWTTPGHLPVELRDTGADGGKRFAALVQIGDADPFEVMVDTGSSGLRVLPGVIPDAAYTDITDELVSETYHSGLALQGVVAHAPVSIAGLTTPTAIPIMRVTTVGCAATDPDCSAAGQDASDYSMFGGYRAVLGIGMRTTTSSGAVGNPIAQLPGHPAFTVRAPDYGAGDFGEIAIGDAPPEAFRTIELATLDDAAPLADGTPAWDDRSVPACVLGPASFCAGAMFDTGAPPTEVEWTAYDGGETAWSPGTQVDVSIDTIEAKETYGFVVEDPPRDGVDRVVIEPRAQTASLINLGTAPFFRYDVRFDQSAGTIAIAAR